MYLSNSADQVLRILGQEYFRLSGKDPADFAHATVDFRAMSRRTDQSLNRLLVAHSERGVEGTVSMTWGYERTWIGHQLARGRNGADRRGVLESLYRQMCEHMMDAHDTEWFMGYIDDGVPWMGRAHLDFATKLAMSNPNQAAVQPIRLLEFLVEPEAQRPPDVHPASEDDLRRISREVAFRFPLPLWKACDLSYHRIKLDDVTERWRTQTLCRQRQILVARAGDVPMAAVIAECMSPGVNFFHLFDAVRFISLAPGGKARFAGLLTAASAWYASKGRRRFVCYDDYSVVHRNCALPARDMGPGHIWIIARDAG